MRDSLDQATRRAVLKGIAGTLGVALAGTASGHPGAGDHGPEGHDHPPEDAAGVGWRGYHSLGGVGGESWAGDPQSPHYGGISELKVQDDLAFVGILSSRNPTYDRGLAILDVSQYTRADSKDELENAQMFLLSFVPNENNATSVMDVKLSNDGNYAFISKQPIAVLFGDHEARTDPDDAGNSPESGALQAVDVSDPGNPEVVGRWDAWGLGPHNSDHLRIGGTDYVFAVKGSIGSNAGIYVVRFDRTTGNMTLVNYWLDGRNLAAGEVADPRKGQYATRGYDYYVHDIRVERDPQTGWPLAYVANLNDGAYVLDASDPMDMQALGHFEMYRAHEIWPITVTGPDGPRRMFVSGQENPSSEWSDGFGSHGQNIDGDTGWLYLVDAQAIDPGNQDEPVDLGTAAEHDSFDPETDAPALARWQLSNQVTFDNYTLSLHNVEPFEVEIPGDGIDHPRQFVAAGHYHAGIRFLEFTEAVWGTVEGVEYTDATTEAGDDVDPEEHDHDDDHAEKYDWGTPPANGDADGMGQVAYFRSHVEDYPEEAKMAALTAATPDFWCAVEENGVVFGSDINTGVYAVTLDADADIDPDVDVPVGSRTPVNVDVERVDAADAYTEGQTVRMQINVDADESVHIRDRVPSEWEVHGAGDEHVTYDGGDGTLVEFTGAVEAGSRTYFAEARETGADTIGPVEYSVDGGDTWRVVAGTLDTNVVVGVSTGLL